MIEKIHVCIINASSHVFGAEKSMAYLVSYLDKNKYIFSLISPGGKTENLFKNVGVSNSFSVPLLRFMKTMNPVTLFFQFLKWVKTNITLYRRLGILNPDIIHANGIQSMVNVCICAYLLKIPTIWHLRDAKQPKWISKLCSVFAHEIVAPNRYIMEKFSFMKKTIHIVPNPIFHSNYRLENNPELKCPDKDSFNIGLIGQIIPRKGHDLLLDVIPVIKEKIQNIKIYFVGDECFDQNKEYLEYLKKKIDNSDLLKDCVIFTGYVDDMENIYRKLDLVVVPSLDEAFGRVAMEAMYYGCPLVVSKTGGMADNVEDSVNGLFFERGNVYDFANAVIRLVTNPELMESLGKKGKSVCSEYIHNTAREVAGVESIYKGCIEFKRTG